MSLSHRRHYSEPIINRMETFFHITRTCSLEFDPRVCDIDRDEVFEPRDTRFWVSGRSADHDRTAVLLDSLQRRTLDDTRVSARSCTEYTNTLAWNADYSVAPSVILQCADSIERAVEYSC